MGIVASAAVYTAVTTAAAIVTNQAAKFVKKNYVNGVSPENATFKHISSEYQKMFDKLVSLYEIINFVVNNSNVVENNSILHFLNKVFIEHLNTLCNNIDQSNTGSCRIRNKAYLERIKMIGKKFLKESNNNVNTDKPTCFRDTKCFKKFDELGSNLKEELEKLAKNIALVKNIHNTNSVTFDENSNFYRGIDINLYEMSNKFLSMQKIFSDLLEYDIKYHRYEIKGWQNRILRNTRGHVSWASNSGYSFKEVAEILERLKENTVDRLRGSIELNKETMNTSYNTLTKCLYDFKNLNYVIKESFNDKLHLKCYIDNNEKTINIDFGNLGLEHNWHSFANKFNDKISEINSNLETNYDIELIVVSTGDDNIVRYGLDQDDNNFLRFVFKSRNRFCISDISTILYEIGFQQQTYISIEKKWEQEVNQQSEIVTEYVIVSENNLNPDLGNLRMTSIENSTRKIKQDLADIGNELGNKAIQRVYNLHSQAANQ